MNTLYYHEKNIDKLYSSTCWSKIIVEKRKLCIFTHCLCIRETTYSCYNIDYWINFSFQVKYLTSSSRYVENVISRNNVGMFYVYKIYRTIYISKIDIAPSKLINVEKTEKSPFHRIYLAVVRTEKNLSIHFKSTKLIAWNTKIYDQVWTKYHHRMVNKLFNSKRSSFTSVFFHLRKRLPTFSNNSKDDLSFLSGIFLGF